MKGIVKFLGIVGVAVGAAVVTVVALNDEQVRAKVAHATEQVKHGVQEIVATVAEGVDQVRKEASLNQVEKNQAWVDRAVGSFGHLRYIV